VRRRVGRWRARRLAARAAASGAEDPLNGSAWPDTAPSSHPVDPIGVDGAPAMVFTDSMPPYPALLDRPRSTARGRADDHPAQRAAIAARR
jgi:hypothetical protein